MSIWTSASPSHNIKEHMSRYLVGFLFAMLLTTSALGMQNSARESSVFSDSLLAAFSFGCGLVCFANDIEGGPDIFRIWPTEILIRNTIAVRDLNGQKKADGPEGHAIRLSSLSSWFGYATGAWAYTHFFGHYHARSMYRFV